MAFDFFKVIIPFVAGVAVGAFTGPGGYAIAYGMAAGAVAGGAYAATQDDDILEGAVIGAAAGAGGAYVGATYLATTPATAAGTEGGSAALTAADTQVVAGGAENYVLGSGGGQSAFGTATTTTTSTPSGVIPLLKGPQAEAAKGITGWINKNPTLAFMGFETIAGAAKEGLGGITAAKTIDAQERAAREAHERSYVRKVGDFEPPKAEIDWAKSTEAIAGYKPKKPKGLLQWPTA